jgi:hypothetical protein
LKKPVFLFTSKFRFAELLIFLLVLSPPLEELPFIHISLAA